MAKVKICGIRRYEDILTINKYLPEYAGFVFAPSKRQVSPEHVKTITVELNPRIKKAGIFVNEDMQKLLKAVDICGLNAIQVHGDEPAEYISNLKKELGFRERNVEVWKAIRVKDKSSLEQMSQYRADAYVLDTYVEGSYGGSGLSFDWKLAAEAGKYGRVILAGGLTPENVMLAIRVGQPFAVDVSSGVETDGWKDEIKIRDFICMARSYYF